MAPFLFFMYTSYEDVLRDKQRTILPNGFKSNYIPDTLFPFQQYAVDKALWHGRFGLFEERGLGKTRQQIIFAYNCVRHTNKHAVIICPLGISWQTIQEGEKIGIEILKADKTTQPSPKIFICNIEQIENIWHLIVTSCCMVGDEFSILKNHEGKYRNAIIDVSRKIPYRLPCTATPSPNDPMELGNYSEFLGVMTRAEMLAMYFVHDGGKTSSWRLKKHAEHLFWKWLTTWAIVISKPSDIGFSDEGYELPPVNYFVHEIKTDVKEGVLFNDTAISATDFNGELRRTAKDRLNKAIEIDAAVTGQNVIWVKHNPEGEYLKKNITGSVEVTGSDELEFKEEMLRAFVQGQIKTLITKGKLCGYGMNWQNCNDTTLASVDHSFEMIWQIIGRFCRFGNLFPVNANMIVSDTMESVLQTFYRKKRQHENMIASTVKSMRENESVTIKKISTTKKITLPTWMI